MQQEYSSSATLRGSGFTEYEELEKCVFNARRANQAYSPSEAMIHGQLLGEYVVQRDAEGEDEEARNPVAAERLSVVRFCRMKGEQPMQMVLAEHTDKERNCPTCRGARLDLVKIEDKLVGHKRRNSTNSRNKRHADHLFLTMDPIYTLAYRIHVIARYAGPMEVSAKEPLLPMLDLAAPERRLTVPSSTRAFHNPMCPKRLFNSSGNAPDLPLSSDPKIFATTVDPVTAF